MFTKTNFSLISEISNTKRVTRSPSLNNLTCKQKQQREPVTLNLLWTVHPLKSPLLHDWLELSSTHPQVPDRSIKGIISASFRTIQQHLSMISHLSRLLNNLKFRYFHKIDGWRRRMPPTIRLPKGIVWSKQFERKSILLSTGPCPLAAFHERFMFPSHHRNLPAVRSQMTT